jgi:hypothetical protein
MQLKVNQTEERKREKAGRVVGRRLGSQSALPEHLSLLFLPSLPLPTVFFILTEPTSTFSPNLVTCLWWGVNAVL